MCLGADVLSFCLVLRGKDKKTPQMPTFFAKIRHQNTSEWESSLGCPLACDVVEIWFSVCFRPSFLILLFTTPKKICFVLRSLEQASEVGAVGVEEQYADGSEKDHEPPIALPTQGRIEG